MSHFAEVKNGIVVQVIVAEQEFINRLPNPKEWIQTSYNTINGVHYSQAIPPRTIEREDPVPEGLSKIMNIPGIPAEPDGGVALRGNFAGIGYIYDSVNDVFYPPQPFPSWTISAPNWTWTPPVAFPTDGKLYNWNEDTKTWVERTT
jgi:hypothetical protein